MARVLKVYWAEIDGLNDWVVAAPNRRAALDALGVNQDLFAQGQAGDAADPGAVGAARRAPLTPLRRPKGSGAPFAPSQGPTDWSAVEPSNPPGSARAKAKPGRKPPSRERLDKDEAALRAVQARHRQAMDEITAERRRLDSREAETAEAFADQEARAKAERDAAAKAYAAAGGR